MSLYSASAWLKTAVQAVTWVIPTEATGIGNATHTAFVTVETEQFSYFVDAPNLPYCRIWIPDVPEFRETTGGDLGSYKRRDYQAILFIYWQSFSKDWDGGSKYFKTIVDATMKYFRHNSAPVGQQALALNSDVIVSWGLKMTSRIELPELYTDALHYRATIGIDVIEYAI